jgi:hypothetical protein
MLKNDERIVGFVERVGPGFMDPSIVLKLFGDDRIWVGYAFENEIAGLLLTRVGDKVELSNTGPDAMKYDGMHPVAVRNLSFVK